MKRLPFIASCFREIPSDASLRERVRCQIESGSMSSLGMATLSETVVESALRRQSARPAKSRALVLRVTRWPSRADGPNAGAGARVARGDVVRAQPSPYSTLSPSLRPTPTSEEPTVELHAVEPASIAPMMSAAETLASFDPFADAVPPGR